MPGEFVCPAFKERFSKSHPGATSYLALPAFERIEGPRGHWEDTHPIDQFLAVYEIDEPRVLWTEPADLDKVYQSFTMGRTPTASFHDTVHLEFLPVAIREVQPEGAQDDAQE